MEMNKKYPLAKLAGTVIISAAALSVSYFLSSLIMQRLAAAVSGFACPAGGFLYMWFTLTCLFLLGCKTDITPEQCRLIPVKISVRWVIPAVIVPGAVCAGLISSVHISFNSSFYNIMYTVFFAGIGTAAAEEGVYRGIMKTAVERRWGKTAAYIVPAAVQAGLFITMQKPEFAYSCTAVCFFLAQGMLLSLIVDKSRSIWNAAAVHAVWNMLFAGTLIRIPEQNTEMMLWSAAAFSFTAAVIAVHDAADQ
jgi:membrane protease YdiL (CAAX protease family)